MSFELHGLAMLWKSLWNCWRQQVFLKAKPGVPYPEPGFFDL
jgi:hypothetical protein